ncbi:hypothetical protein ACIPRI_16620 [Variovorax sp. LARHSF232]
MNASSYSTGWELRFDPLCDGHRGYAFPRDAAGHVDMDSLGGRARHNYLYARAMMGRETAWPDVRPTQMH